MFAKLDALLDRVQVRWHAVVAALVTALPVLLDQLGYIDLKPILSHFLPEDYVALVVGLMPFVLAFLKPMINVAPQEPEE